MSADGWIRQQEAERWAHRDPFKVVIDWLGWLGR